jgi:ribosomal-protein-alanine N-acetyltransferase
MIRQAKLDDLPALAALHGVCFTDGWSVDSLGQLLASPGAFALITEQVGRPAGFILARNAAGEAEILTLAVASAARHAGLGRALICQAARHAATCGANVVFLEVAVANAAARSLYGALGFEEAGRRKGYYVEHPGSAPGDALVLKAELPLRPLGKGCQVD